MTGKRKKPKVKSVGTVDFNVNTESGLNAYNKALKASEGLTTDKARDAATTEVLHGERNRKVAAANKAAKSEKFKAGAEAVSSAAGQIGELASKMASFHADSFKGLSPSATAVREGVKPYNYQPESMTPKAETSPMVRYDSDYEKEKKKLGL